MDIQEIITFIVVGLAVLSLIFPLFKKKKMEKAAMIQVVIVGGTRQQ